MSLIYFRIIILILLQMSSTNKTNLLESKSKSRIESGQVHILNHHFPQLSPIKRRAQPVKWESAEVAFLLVVSSPSAHGGGNKGPVLFHNSKPRS